MTDQHAATYHAYLAAQAEANSARGSTQPTPGNVSDASTPEAARLAALDAAAAWDRHCAAVLSDVEPGPNPGPEPEPEACI